jgi:transposase
LPPDVREWLPEDHLAWLVIDAVGVMDLAAFYAAYREDGHGHAAYQPSMMVALLLYCWARGVRSARRIERGCLDDVACRVIAAHQRPDHSTIARFVVRHERALGELFGEVLALCADAGLATVGVIAIDGTKVAANANRDRTMDYTQLARAIVEEQIDTDAAEDERHGPGARRRAAARADPLEGSAGVAARGQAPARGAARRPSQADRALAARAPQGRQATTGRGATDRAARQQGL